MQPNPESIDKLTVFLQSKYKIEKGSLNPAWQSFMKSRNRDFTLCVFYPHLVSAYSDLKLRVALDMDNKNSRMLEVGCGSGWLALQLSKCGSSIVAIDTSSESLVYAQELCKAEQCHVNFIRASATHLPFQTASFQGLISYEVLEHVPEISNTIIEFRRVLSQKGRLIISIPNGYGTWEIVNTLLSRMVFGYIDAQKHHVHNFTRDSFTNILRSAGFTIYVFYSIDSLGGILWYIFGALRRQIPKVFGKADIKMAKCLPVFLGSHWLILSEKNYMYAISPQK